MSSDRSRRTGCWMLLALAASCGTTHEAGSSLRDQERAEERRRQEIAALCADLPGERRAVCLDKGPPTAPDRKHWADSSWWLYRTRGVWSYDGNVHHSASYRCYVYVSFDGHRLAQQSDEQCREVSRWVEK